MAGGNPMYAEDDLLPVSALQHLLFCPRQCALIHVERLWAENRFTIEGRHLHEKADAGRGESRKRPGTRAGGKAGRGGGTAGAGGGGGTVRIARGLMLRSLRLGLYGKADVVEFRPAPAGPAPGVRPPSPPGVADPADPAAASPAPPGTVPFPVEYKRGKPKRNRCDEVQLCAQALCLEEMLGVAVPAGAIFYGTTRRRTDVAFDPELRALTGRLIGELRAIVDDGRTPAAAREKKCERCSLIRLCLPEARPGTGAAGRYLKRAVGQALAADGGPAGD